MTGTALFLVESKYFDDAKAKKATAAENRKRKAAEKALGLPPTKRTRLENGAQSTAQDTMAPEGDNRDDDDDDEKDEDEDAEDEAERLAFEAGRRAAYEKVPVLERKRGTRPVEQIEPVMDDLINAKTRPDVGCSCKPAKLYFRQDMHGK